VNAFQKTALISGGAKGIGRELGLRLGERGWAVALCYRKSRAEATRLPRRSEAGRPGPAIHADVSTPECVGLVARCSRTGRVALMPSFTARVPIIAVDVLDETRWAGARCSPGNLDSFFYLARLVAPVDGESSKTAGIVAFSMANADR